MYTYKKNILAIGTLLATYLFFSTSFAPHNISDPGKGDWPQTDCNMDDKTVVDYYYTDRWPVGDNDFVGARINTKNEWNGSSDAQFRLEYEGETPGFGGISENGYNEIAYTVTAGPNDVGGVTQCWLGPFGNILVECDLIMSSEITWTFNPNNNNLPDFESAMLHEVGHLQGLVHLSCSGDRPAMCDNIAVNEVRRTINGQDQDAMQTRYCEVNDGGEDCSSSNVSSLAGIPSQRRKNLLKMLAAETDFENKEEYVDCLKSITRNHDDAARMANNFILEHKDFLTSDSDVATSEVVSDAKSVLSKYEEYASSYCQVTGKTQGVSSTPRSGSLADRLVSLRNRLDEMQGMTFEEMKTHLLREVPDEFTLKGNAPNPFSSTTTITYGLKETAKVTVEVYDMMGRRVRTLVDERQTTGFHRIQFSADGLSSGAYVYRITTGDTKETGRMTVVQ